VACAVRELARQGLDGAALVGNAAGDYLFSARVGVRFASTFDAGVLMLFSSESVWAKLCFELSPQEPTIVSVVTLGTSDHANGSSSPATRCDAASPASVPRSRPLSLVSCWCLRVGV
jgi:hypothetical protein